MVAVRVYIVPSAFASPRSGLGRLGRGPDMQKMVFVSLVLVGFGCGSDSLLSSSELSSRLRVDHVEFAFDAEFTRVVGKVLVTNTGADISTATEIRINMIAFDADGQPLDEGSDFEKGFPGGTQKLFDNIIFFDIETLGQADRIADYTITWEHIEK